MPEGLRGFRLCSHPDDSVMILCSHPAAQYHGAAFIINSKLWRNVFSLHPPAGGLIGGFGSIREGAVHSPVAKQFPPDALAAR